MNDLTQRLLLGADQIGAVLPGLVAAVLILLAGYFLARQISRVLDRLLKRIDFNRAAHASGLDEVVHRTGARLDPVRAVTRLVFWFVMLVVTLLASTALGLDSINEMFGQMLSFLPALIAAIVIIILGMIVGEFVRGLILASAGNLPGVPLVAQIAKGAVVIIAVFMALQQVGVAGEIVTTTLTLIVGAVALATGLAFGLGNTQLAGEVTRRWYEEHRRSSQVRLEAELAREEDPAEPPMLD